MPTSKVSTTLDSELVEQVRSRVGPRRISAFVNQALEEKLQRIRVLELLDELEAENGPATEDDVKRAAAELAKIFRAS